jgi:hypothetical protein
LIQRAEPHLGDGGGDVRDLDAKRVEQLRRGVAVQIRCIRNRKFCETQEITFQVQGLKPGAFKLWVQLNSTAVHSTQLCIQQLCIFNSCAFDSCAAPRLVGGGAQLGGAAAAELEATQIEQQRGVVAAAVITEAGAAARGARNDRPAANL